MARANKVGINSNRNEQVKTSDCRIKVYGISSNVTLFNY